MARREEEADPQRSVTDKQRRQRALPSQTLRAAGLSGLDCVGSGGTDRRRSAPPLTALPNPEFPSRRTPPHFQTGSKVFDSHDDGSYYEGEMLKVEFADLDGDGDFDLVIGLSEDGRVKYIPNTGTKKAPEFLEANSSIWFDVGLFAYPILFDLDGDKLLDAVVVGIV